MSPVRGYITSYPPRVRQYGNALLTPVLPPTQATVPSRTTKRGTTAINYAEDGFDDDDFEDSEGPRRPTGLRSLRRDESSLDKTPMAEKLGKEIHAPVQVQGIFRDWMIKRMLRPAYVLTAILFSLMFCSVARWLTHICFLQLCGPVADSGTVASHPHSHPNRS